MCPTNVLYTRAALAAPCHTRDAGHLHGAEASGRREVQLALAEGREELADQRVAHLHRKKKRRREHVVACDMKCFAVL